MRPTLRETLALASEPAPQRGGPYSKIGDTAQSSGTLTESTRKGCHPDGLLEVGQIRFCWEGCLEKVELHTASEHRGSEHPGEGKSSN